MTKTVKSVHSSLTCMLLHVVKASLPVELDVDILTLLQSRSDEMDSFRTLPHHTQDGDAGDRPEIIGLAVKENTKIINTTMTCLNIVLSCMILTCPPPSGNRIVSFSFTLKPFTFSFLPLFSTFNSTGSHDTTDVSNCKRVDNKTKLTIF